MSLVYATYLWKGKKREVRKDGNKSLNPYDPVNKVFKNSYGHYNTIEEFERDYINRRNAGKYLTNYKRCKELILFL